MSYISDNLLIIIVGTAAISTFTALVLIKNLPRIFTICVIVGITFGIYLEAVLNVPVHINKLYFSVMFFVLFFRLGKVETFGVAWWEYSLLAFYMLRLPVDLLRSDLEMSFMFGAVGDGVFLTGAYLYYKKLFSRYPALIDSILKIFVFFSLIFAVIGIIEFSMGRDLFIYPVDPRFFIESRIRANSVFYGPETFGLSMAFSFFTVLFLCQRKKIPLLLSAILLMILGGGLFTSLYRGIWIAFVAGLLFFYWLKKYDKNLIKVVARSTIALLLVFSLGATIQYLIKDTDFYGDRIANLQNWESRSVAYRSILKGIPGGLLLGHGTGSVKDYLMSSHDNIRGLSSPHNVYLNILYENGLILFFLFMSWFGGFFFHVLKLKKNKGSIFGGVLIITLVTSISMNILPAFDYPWLLFAVSGGLFMSRQIEGSVGYAQSQVKHN